MYECMDVFVCDWASSYAHNAWYYACMYCNYFYFHFCCNYKYYWVDVRTNIRECIRVLVCVCVYVCVGVNWMYVYVYLSKFKSMCIHGTILIVPRASLKHIRPVCVSVYVRARFFVFVGKCEWTERVCTFIYVRFIFKYMCIHGTILISPRASLKHLRPYY